MFRTFRTEAIPPRRAPELAKQIWFIGSTRMLVTRSPQPGNLHTAFSSLSNSHIASFGTLLVLTIFAYSPQSVMGIFANQEIYDSKSWSKVPEPRFSLFITLLLNWRIQIYEKIDRRASDCFIVHFFLRVNLHHDFFFAFWCRFEYAVWSSLRGF